MTTISPSLNQQLYRVLLRCGPFDSNANFKAIFVDARISEWRNLLPDATPSRQARVEAVVNALGERFNTDGKNALVLLLHVLRDRTSSYDSCHSQLGTLANALAQELKPPTIPPQTSNSGTDSLHSSDSFRKRKRTLVQQRLDALIEEYEAANTQLMQSLAEVDRVRIRRQMETLEKQIQETEVELAAV